MSTSRFVYVSFLIFLVPNTKAKAMPKKCKRAFQRQKKIKEISFSKEIRGTVIEGQSDKNTVLIWDGKDRLTRIHKIGDKLTPNTILCWVGRKKIIVLFAGRLGLVTMDDDEEPSISIPKVPLRRRSRGPIRRLPSFAKRFRVSHIKRKDLSSWLRKPLRQQGANYSPHLRYGRPTGMKLTSLRSGSFLHRLGLRKGDVLVRVNGRRAISPGYAQKAFRRSSMYRSLRIQVKRRGRIKYFDYSLR